MGSWLRFGPWILALGCAAPADGAPPKRPRADVPGANLAPRAQAAPFGAAALEGSASAAPQVAPPDAPPAVEWKTVSVAGDKPVLVVPGMGRTPIVYLHGRCGDPTAFRAWARAGSKFGTIVSFVGDKRCKHSERSHWGDDVGALDRRVTRALAAVEVALGVDLDEEHRVVIGYSQGALKAEALATRFPARYPRAALIGGPRAPRDESLRKTESVLLMAGDRDARDHLREASRKLEKRGKKARYLELPGAAHGEYGPKAEPTMEAALGWLLSTPGPF